ncbi:MAG TPA: hypothetical protein VMM13_20915, partial [Euzebya sp.]|nr:hypothetical protein [Euzebya sp.]
TASGWIARPIAREGVAALRGAVTGTVGLLALALVLIVALGMRELAIAGGEGVVGGITGTILLLPTALVVVAGMTLAVPVVVQVGGLLPALGTGEPVASVGLRGIEGLTGPATSVPAWFWLIMLAAVAVLVLAGAGATWRAAAEGVKATRAGMAIGPMMALLWVPLGLVAAGSVRFEDGAGDLLLVLRAIGLRGLGGAADGGLRVGLASGLLFATLLVAGAAAGWLGSLLAKRLWGRAPTWVVHLLGGRPRPATSADVAAAPPPSSPFSETSPPPSSGPPHPW